MLSVSLLYRTAMGPRYFIDTIDPRYSVRSHSTFQQGLQISGISTVKLETYGADATSSTRRRSRMRTEKESRVPHVEAALWETPANTDNLLSINEMMLWALSIGVGSNINVSSSLCSRHRKPTSIHHTTRRSHTVCGKF